jgi:transketolase
MDLTYVPAEEFARIGRLGLAPEVHARLFATLCRLNTLYMIARAGSGHIGSSFSSLDLVVWLQLHEQRRTDGGLDSGDDLYFSSKGHDVPGLYAVLQALGVLPFETIHTLRRLGGLPGHPDVHTPGMVTNTGPLGMGISKAKGILHADRLRGRQRRVFVMTGDGELQEGQIWESLVSAANDGTGELTVIVDHNTVQSDTFVRRVSDLGDLEAKFAAFGWVVQRCDGHDFAAIAAALDRLRAEAGRPKLLLADTIKGAGVSFMEHTAMPPGESLYRFHSGAPDDVTTEKAMDELVGKANRILVEAGAAELTCCRAERPARPDLSGAQRLVGAYSRALLESAKKRSDLVVLDADLALDCGLLPFAERHPERFIECGIAEQDMVSQAGGLALAGMLPVVHSFACFLSTRPNEQIYNNATEGKKVVYVASLAGLLPGAPGHSHQCVRDISALAAVPGLVLLEPSCEREVELAVDYCFERAATSCYLRLVSVPCQVPYEIPSGHRLEEGRGVVLRSDTDAVLFGYGPVLLPEAWHAAEILQERHGVSLEIVNLPWLNRVDRSWLAAAIGGRRRVFTVDNHYLTGGQGEMLAAAIAELGLGVPVRRFGVSEIPACGQNDEVLCAHGLDAESLATAIAEALQ